MRSLPPRGFPGFSRTFLVFAALALLAAGVSVMPPRTVTRVVSSAGSGSLSDGDSAEQATEEKTDGLEGSSIAGRRATAETLDPSHAAAELGTDDALGNATAGDATESGGRQGGPVECAPGRNGGATDVGVTADTIKLGATVVDSGTGASFLRDARYGIQAVMNKVNREGGICGRKLAVEFKDDAWDEARGKEFIRNLVEGEGVFALAVVPSSEGLNAASQAGYLAQQGVPVIGSDGMLKSQYTDPYIWPVAASTVSTMHIIAQYAATQLGAKNFAIVFDTFYKFGREGARAFNASVARLTGGGIQDFDSGACTGRACGILAAQASYTDQVNRFNRACANEQDLNNDGDTDDPGEGRCDFIALLLEPTTALTWIQQGALILGGGSTHGAQPLFTREFAEPCKQKCDGMWVWTGYIPAIGGNLGRPAVKRFRDDLLRTNSSADITNAFAEGAYTGMSLLVEALKQVGPNLTRERLRTVLDNMTFDPGLTAQRLTWRKGNHFANVTMQAYSIQFGDRFAGWRDQQVSATDPWIGQDIEN